MDAAWEQCDVVLEGEVRVGGQEHFYLEPQGTIVLPGENDEMTVISSTQVCSPACLAPPQSCPTQSQNHRGSSVHPWQLRVQGPLLSTLYHTGAGI